jgi:hypothetical protein
MPRMFCTLMLLLATASASLAQDAGTVPPAVVKALAPPGKLRAAINVSNIVLAQRDPAGFIAAALARSNQPDATVAPAAGN